MDPPKSPIKPDLHPILARRYFDKLEDQSMRNSSVSERMAALEAREREITRDRRDNEAVAADLLRRERSVIESERRLAKREKEIDSRPTREEVEMLKAQLEEAEGEGKSAVVATSDEGKGADTISASKNKHKFQSAVDEHNYLAKKYHSVKQEHERTKRDFGGEIVRLGKVAKELQGRLSETEKKLGDQRVENLELKMRNAELETRNEFLEKEYRRRLTGSEEKEEKTHHRRPSRIPVAMKEKKNDENIPVSHFAKSTVASRARAVSSSPPPTTEKKEVPIATGKEQDLATNSEPSGPRTMHRTASVASTPGSAGSFFTSLPPPAYGAFDESGKPTPVPPTRSSNREAMSQGYYSAADLLARGPPVPPHATVPLRKITPPIVVAANTAKKITPSTSKPRPASYASENNDDDIAYPHSAVVDGDGAKKHIKKKYSQDFRDAVKRSLPWLKKETMEIYSEAFL